MRIRVHVHVLTDEPHAGRRRQPARRAAPVLNVPVKASNQSAACDRKRLTAVRAPDGATSIAMVRNALDLT